MNSPYHADCNCVFTSTTMPPLSTSVLIVSWACRVVAAAMSYLGVPYVWGGASRGGVDVTVQVELERDAGRPQVTGRGHLGDPRDPAKLPL